MHMQSVNRVSTQRAEDYLVFTCRALTASLHRELKSISMHMQGASHVSAQRAEEYRHLHAES
jgi:hypothetical protein